MVLEQLQRDADKLAKGPKLTDAVSDVDDIIALLTDARGNIAADNDPSNINSSLARLQNPIKERLTTLTNHLKGVHKTHADFNKSLKTAFAPTNAKGSLPTDDTMGSHLPLIDRAIAMHLLREGHFSVANSFLDEANASPSMSAFADAKTELHADSDSEEDEDEDEDEEGEDQPEYYLTKAAKDQLNIHPTGIRAAFSDMYSILSSIKARKLLPAIEWAKFHTADLEVRGSNLEFELCRLQFVWTFCGSAVNGLPPGPLNGPQGALQYARSTFARFHSRHARDIQRLSCTLVYAPNIAEAPYRALFQNLEQAFADVAASFTREFCSLLGLSAESPLYVAATAGALALPRFVKYTNINRAKGTAWTTEQELAFETPLPLSMMYHAIFVCPVSKEQATHENPPMMLTCGHTIARDSLNKLAKLGKCKCPYCPVESLVKDTIKITM